MAELKGNDLFVRTNTQTMDCGLQFQIVPAHTTPRRLLLVVADRMMTEVVRVNEYNSFIPNAGAIDGWIGVLYREGSSVTHAEHSSFVQWVKRLPIDGTARIGDLECTDTLDTRREITEHIIKLEGCSPEDREEARKAAESQS